MRDGSKSCCYGCSHRAVGCHAFCAEYQAEMAEAEKARLAKEQAWKDGSKSYYDLLRERIRQQKKNHKI